MKALSTSGSTPVSPITLQKAVDGLCTSADLSNTRKRDLRSAVVAYGKIVGQPLTAIPLDVAEIRKTLDGVVPLQAKVSRKRWANLRSDLAAAIVASGAQPMLKTADVKPNKDWEELLESVDDRRLKNGLSRLARWATLGNLPPGAVNNEVLAHFFAELESNSLVRNVRAQRRAVAKLWNSMVAVCADRGLRPVDVPAIAVNWRRIPWSKLPKTFRQETEAYITWCSNSDPLEKDARVRALAPETLRLRRSYIHLAATAACASDTEAKKLTSLSRLVEEKTFRSILRQQWEKNGRKTSPHLLALADALIVLASEWVKVSPERLAGLKALRRKLGSVPHGLTEKNRSLLRKLEDPRLLRHLVNLPDHLWRRGRRSESRSRYWFVELQNALAIDILLHSPLRIEDLGALKFDEQVHWPQGKGKPALVVLRQGKVPDADPLEVELPVTLSDRLFAFRNEIALAVIGCRPDFLFVSAKGKPRTLATLRVAIQRAALRHVGIRITPHQFRHLAAKIHLDANPGAYEVVRQFLGHKTLRTTTRFYAGPDTRRAGRAHAALIQKLRDEPNPPNRDKSKWSV